MVYVIFRIRSSHFGDVNNVHMPTAQVLFVELIPCSWEEKDIRLRAPVGECWKREDWTAENLNHYWYLHWNWKWSKLRIFEVRVGHVQADEKCREDQRHNLTLVKSCPNNRNHIDQRLWNSLTTSASFRRRAGTNSVSARALPFSAHPGVSTLTSDPE